MQSSHKPLSCLPAHSSQAGKLPCSGPLWPIPVHPSHLPAAASLIGTASAAQVNAVRKSGRFAWVEFGTLQAAQQALTLDGESLGAGVMKVSQSKTPIHTAGWRAQVSLTVC